MKKQKELSKELHHIESLLLSQVIGGNPDIPPGCEIPCPIGGTNCELVYCDTYTGSQFCIDYGWFCDDQGPVY